MADWFSRKASKFVAVCVAAVTNGPRRPARAAGQRLEPALGQLGLDGDVREEDEVVVGDVGDHHEVVAVVAFAFYEPILDLLSGTYRVALRVTDVISPLQAFRLSSQA